MSEPSVTTWTYWRPHEGTHYFDTNELHVGIVHDETNVPVLIAAVVPPLPTDPPSQAEGFARAIRDALAALDTWEGGDGLEPWARAHGMATGVPWPR